MELGIEYSLCWSASIYVEVNRVFLKACVGYLFESLGNKHLSLGLYYNKYRSSLIFNIF